MAPFAIGRATEHYNCRRVPGRRGRDPSRRKVG